MKIDVKLSGLLALGLGVAICGCGKKGFTSWKAVKSPDVAAQLKSFVSQKEAQANSSTNESVPEYAPFFAAAKSGNWLTVSNAFKDLRNHAG
jgi:hypothetical protein